MLKFVYARQCNVYVADTHWLIACIVVTTPRLPAKGARSVQSFRPQEMGLAAHLLMRVPVSKDMTAHVHASAVASPPWHGVNRQSAHTAMSDAPVINADLGLFLQIVHPRSDSEPSEPMATRSPEDDVPQLQAIHVVPQRSASAELADLISLTVDDDKPKEFIVERPPGEPEKDDDDLEDYPDGGREVSSPHTLPYH